MSRAKAPSEFEIGKLASLVEPLTVRVERIKGSLRTPIELPSKDPTQQPNTMITGLARDDIAQLEKMVFQLAGGGIYKAKVNDVNGQELEWSFGWQAPEKPMIQADAFGAPVVAQQPAMGQPSSWGVPTGYGMPAPAAAPATPIQPMGGWPGMGWGMAPGYGPQMYAPAPDTRRLEEQLAAERMARQEERHRMELDRLRQEFAAAARPAGPDPTVLALQEELRREREERKRAEERMERDRAEERHRAEMQAMREEIRALAAAPKGPDPMIEFMRESARQQAESMKEIARAQQMQFERLSALTMNPAQLLDMVEKKGSSVDTTVKGMVDSFSGIMDLQQRVVENMMQLNGPEPPAISIVKDGIQTAKDLATRYIRSKEAEKAAAANVEVVRAQASAVQAQAVAHAQAAQAQAQIQPAPPAPQPPPAPAAPAAPLAEAAPTPEPAPEPKSVPYGAPSEAEMLGPAVEHVHRLRMGVRNGLAPDEVVKAIIRGIEFAEANKLEIPAFELLRGGHFAEVVEILIPDAPTALKEIVTNTLAEAYEPDEDDTVPDEEEDEDTDEEPESASAR